jgi:4-amino-4-deoxy-L-arabinose transferase-like glycosyltransferase
LQNSTSYWFNKTYFQSGEQDKFNLVWLAIIAIGIIFIGIGLRDPWPADEPRFAQIAREMVETGQWFFPMRGGELYPDKPPIFMWSIAVFYYLTGSLSISFLLPNALCSLLTTFLVYDLGKRLWSPQVGWYAALLLLMSLQFVLQAKSAQIDAMVCCWITIGCYGLIRHLILQDGWRWFMLGCFFMGIGVITKGVGFLPILMLIPYFVVRFMQPQLGTLANNEIKGSWQWFAGILVLLAATLLWFIPMMLLVEHSQNPLFEQYRDNILFKQTAKRYANSWHHVKPFWYYLVEVVPVFWLPISLLLPWLAKHWTAAIKQGDRRISLLLGWIVLVLIFFSISPGKRGVYILPALPMLALISAPYLKEILTKAWPKRLLFGLVILLSSIALIVGIAGFVEIKATLKLTQKYHIEPWLYFSVIGVTGLLVSFFTRQKKVITWLIAIPLYWGIYSTWGYQLLNDVKTPRNVINNITQIIPKNSELAMLGFREQFLLFSPFPFTHFGYHTPHEQAQRKAWAWQSELNLSPRYLLTFKGADMPCYNMKQAIEVGRAHREDWLLLPTSARKAHCPAADNSVQAFTFVPKTVI